MKKEEFIVGQWYCHTPYEDKDKIWYFKYLKEGTYTIASEFINDNGTYSKEKGSFDCKNDNFYPLLNISEIAKYLPEGHEDLQKSDELIFQLY